MNGTPYQVVARELGINPQSLYSRIKSGTVKAEKLPVGPVRSTYLIPNEEIERLKRQKAEKQGANSPLKALRLKKGYTSIYHLAAEVGCAPANVSKWESGYCNPCTTHYRTLLKLLGPELHECFEN